MSEEKNTLPDDDAGVYATVIEKILKSPIEPTLGKWSGRINFL